MPKRTALIIAYYFPPMGLSGVQRTLKFVKYLPEFDWLPIVLTSSSDKFYAFDDSLQRDLENSEVKVFRTGESPVSFSAQKFKAKRFPSFYLWQKLGRAALQTIYQPDSKIKWKKQAIEYGSRILSKNKVDVIFATAPPFTDFLVARELSKQFKIPYVVDYRDVWVDNPFHFYATPFHKSYSIKLERDILTHAEKIIVTTRNTKELILKRYGLLSHNDIIIIPHGFDPEDFSDLSDIQPNPGKFTITHSGLFQDNRSPKYFLKALSEFIRKKPAAAKNIEARFVGIMRKSHLGLIKKFNLLNNVVCTGYLNHKDSIKEILESDVLWLMLDDTVRSPGKLFEYFGASKPILCCAPDGVIRRIALDSKASLATDPKDVESIERAIGTFYNLWNSNNLPKLSESFIEQYNRKYLTGELARTLEHASHI